LTELGEMSEGFEPLGTNLFDLSAELDQAIVFGVGKSFRISLLKQDLLLSKEIGRNALIDFQQELGFIFWEHWSFAAGRQVHHLLEQ
jgi:hypothetical protein